MLSSHRTVVLLLLFVMLAEAIYRAPHPRYVGSLRARRIPPVKLQKKPKNCCPFSMSGYRDLKGAHKFYEPVPKTLHRHIKPVTERIEDDIKYDFRTKTHSYD